MDRPVRNGDGVRRHVLDRADAWTRADRGRDAAPHRAAGRHFRRRRAGTGAGGAVSQVIRPYRTHRRGHRAHVDLPRRTHRPAARAGRREQPRIRTGAPCRHRGAGRHHGTGVRRDPRLDLRKGFHGLAVRYRAPGVRGSAAPADAGSSVAGGSSRACGTSGTADRTPRQRAASDAFRAGARRFPADHRGGWVDPHVRRHRDDRWRARGGIRRCVARRRSASGRRHRSGNAQSRPRTRHRDRESCAIRGHGRRDRLCARSGGDDRRLPAMAQAARARPQI